MASTSSTTTQSTINVSIGGSPSDSVSVNVNGFPNASVNVTLGTSQTPQTQQTIQPLPEQVPPEKELEESVVCHEEPKKKVVDVQIYPQVYEKDTVWTIRTLIWFNHLINKIYAICVTDGRVPNTYLKTAFNNNEYHLSYADVSYLGTTDSKIPSFQLELQRVSKLLHRKYQIDRVQGDQDRRDQQLEHNDSVTCSKMLNAIIKCFCPVTIGSISVVDNSKPDVIGDIVFNPNAEDESDDEDVCPSQQPESQSYQIQPTVFRGIRIGPFSPTGESATMFSVDSTTNRCDGEEKPITSQETFEQLCQRVREPWYLARLAQLNACDHTGFRRDDPSIDQQQRQDLSYAVADHRIKPTSYKRIGNNIRWYTSIVGKAVLDFLAREDTHVVVDEYVLRDPRYPEGDLNSMEYHFAVNSLLETNRATPHTSRAFDGTQKMFTVCTTPF